MLHRSQGQEVQHGEHVTGFSRTFTCTCIYPQACFYSLTCCTTAQRRLWKFRQTVTRCFLCCRHRFVWLNVCTCVTVGAWKRKQRALVMMVAVCLCTLHQLVFIACLRKDSYFWSNIRLQTVTEQCEDFLCVFHTFQAVNTLLQHKEPSGLLAFAETLSLWPSGSSFVFWISLV